MNNPITKADLQSIYASYRYWIDVVKQEEDWWAGHGYDDSEYTFDINFVLGYETDDLEDTNDWGVFLYPVDTEGYLDTQTWTDVTDEFKAYLLIR
jgi:hypothetical protein